MDNINRVQTKTTFMLLRAEYGVALGVCVVAFFGHIGEIRWIPAVLLFAYIDVIGYLPGFVVHRRAENQEISRTYYVLYNTMHSFVTQSVVVGLWIWIYGFEWALLVIPIHLCADRAIFGNFLKSFRDPFEPTSRPPTRTSTSRQPQMPTSQALRTDLTGSSANGAVRNVG
jgi:hypothetical protein